jgi:transcriptional regulator with XRE-family HTH domain
MTLTFGERLVYLRKQHGLTQTQLAVKAGVPVPTLNALEHGTRKGNRVAVEIAQRLARALGVSLDYLTGMYEEEDIGSEDEPAAVGSE